MYRIPMANPRTQYQMKVETIIDHTAIVRELKLKNLTETPFEFKAGQFAMLHVPDKDGGKPALRAYSIASEDQRNNGFDLLFKFVETGKASTFVWSLKGGEILTFTGPFGRVFFQEPPTAQIVFLNTGTGLSQHLSYLLSKKARYPHLKYKMFFGVRTEKDIYFEKQLLELKKELPNFDFNFVLSRPSESWTGKKGYVQTPTTFYLCGNGGLIKETKEKLTQQGFDSTKVWAEAFD